MSAKIPQRWKYQGRHSRFAAGAAKQAMHDSGLDDGKLDPTRFGVYLGSGEGQQDFVSFTRMMADALDGETLDVAAFTAKGLETLHPIAELEQEPQHAGRRIWQSCSTPRGRTPTA